MIFIISSYSIELFEYFSIYALLAIAGVAWLGLGPNMYTVAVCGCHFLGIRLCKFPPYFSDFNLSGDCSGTDIIQECTKWFQMRVHGLEIGQIFAKCQRASVQKNTKKMLT